MLKRARLAAAVWALVSFSTPAWAQLLSLIPLVPAQSPTQIAFCCSLIDSNNVGRTCTEVDLSPAAVNSCKNSVLVCNPGSVVQCEPAVTGAGKDCACYSFSSFSN